MKDVITVVGAGYVGLTAASVIASAGYKTNLIDVDERKIEIIKRGRSHFFEAGLDKLVKSGIDSENLIPTTEFDSLKETDILFSCVGTPDREDGSSNLDYIFQVADKVAHISSGEIIYVQKSTVPVGTGKKIKKYIASKNSDLKVKYVSNPEFLREGSAVYDTIFFDRLVIGGEDLEAMSKVEKVFKDVDEWAKKYESNGYGDYVLYASHPDDSGLPFEEKTIKINIESAELVKVTSNAFLALKISFANNIAKVADKTGANVKEVFDAVGMDRRINRSFLYPGLGWGGGCFPKDVSGLTKAGEELGLNMKILKEAYEENRSMVDYVADRVISISPKNKEVGILGLSFKPGTSDVRKSPAIALVKKLLDKGFKVTVNDPEAFEEAKHELGESVIYEDDPKKVIENHEIVVIATDWKVYKDTDWSKINRSKLKYVLDARNCSDKKDVESNGLEYIGIGVN